MHTVFPMGTYDIIQLRTHTCYDRGRGACCVLPAGTLNISVIAPIWGHTRVRR